MIDAIKSLFGKSVNYKLLIEAGAQIIDVRAPQEYATGHIKGSENMPLDQLDKHIQKLDKSKPIITCCASGIRSGSAKNKLTSTGFKEVYNGGGWMSLNSKI